MKNMNESVGDRAMRSDVIAWIKNNYQDVLGAEMKLLESPEGLERLRATVRQKLAEKGIILEPIREKA